MDRALLLSHVARLDPVTFKGQKLCVRELDAHDSIQLGQPSEVPFPARMVAKTLCYEDGTRVFTDDDAAAVAALPWKQTKGAFTAAMKLNEVEKDADPKD